MQQQQQKKIEEMSTETVLHIFEEAQRSAATHKGGVRALSALLQKQDDAGLEGVMTVILRNCLDQCLVCTKKEASVDRVIKFFSEFLGFKDHGAKKGEAIFRAGMEHLLARSMAADKTVRYRSCQVIASVISAMDGDVLIDEEVWEAMLTTLTPRLRDKAPNVRMWAVKAVARLQSEETVALTDELARLMGSDASTAVRVAACDHILVSKKNVHLLAARVRDVKPEVRVASLEHLRKDVDPRHMTVEMRCMIVTHGLNDRDAGGKTAAQELVLKWCGMLDHNIPKLLQLFNLGANEPTAELLGRAIIEINASGAAKNLTIPAALKTAIEETCPRWPAGVAALTPAEIYWSFLRCDYARTHSNLATAQNVAEALIPDTVVLCSLLQEAHAKASLRDNTPLQLCCRYLLKLTGFLDRADVSGGRSLVDICETMLIDVLFPEGLVGDVLDAWCKGLGTSGQSSDEAIIEAITNLSEKFGSMEGLELDEASLEILAATRGLQLVEWATRRGICTQRPEGGTLPFIVQNFGPFCLDSLQSTSPDMRRLAVQCLGLMGVSSPEACDAHRDILQQVAATELEEEEIRIEAMKALVDMAVVHTSKFLDQPILVNLLLRMSEGSAALKLLAAECSAKLLFAGTLTEPRLFAACIRLFFLPDQADEDPQACARAQQLLAVFFQSFFMAGKGRERVAWESISDIVSDVALLVRSDQAPSSVLGLIMNHLLSMCENVEKLALAHSTTAQTNAGVSVCDVTVQEVLDDSETARVACRARLAASVSREILKFGASKQDKAAAKDFVKVLVCLEPELWASPAVASTMYRVTQCVSSSGSLDKASQILLEEYAILCKDVVEACHEDEYEPAKGSEQEHTFFGFAPGLLDLVSGMMEVSSQSQPHPIIYIPSFLFLPLSH